MSIKGQSGSPRGEAGQILLIVILVVIVASTIGLSLASRTITSLRSSTEEAESQKALAAAEAGIERATQGNAPQLVRLEGNVSIGVSDNLNNNSAYSTQFTQVQSSSFLLNGWTSIIDPITKAITGMIPNSVSKDEGADVWFVGHNANGSLDSTSVSPSNLNLYWGSTSESCNGSAPAAIEVVVLTNESGIIKSYKYTYDGCSRGNGFKSIAMGTYSAPGIAGVTFSNRTPFADLARDSNNNILSNIILMRVIPIYKDAVVGISTCSSANPPDCSFSLPNQGYIVTSIGTSGEVSKKITVFKGYPQAYLPYLSYGLFVAN